VHSSEKYEKTVESSPSYLHDSLTRPSRDKNNTLTLTQLLAKMGKELRNKDYLVFHECFN